MRRIEPISCGPRRCRHYDSPRWRLFVRSFPLASSLRACPIHLCAGTCAERAVHFVHLHVRRLCRSPPPPCRAIASRAVRGRCGCTLSNMFCLCRARCAAQCRGELLSRTRAFCAYRHLVAARAQRAARDQQAAQLHQQQQQSAGILYVYKNASYIDVYVLRLRSSAHWLLLALVLRLRCCSVPRQPAGRAMG